MRVFRAREHLAPRMGSDLVLGQMLVQVAQLMRAVHIGEDVQEPSARLPVGRLASGDQLLHPVMRARVRRVQDHMSLQLLRSGGQEPPTGRLHVRGPAGDIDPRHRNVSGRSNGLHQIRSHASHIVLEIICSHVAEGHHE